MIYLIAETYTQNTLLQWVTTETKRMVYCDVLSVYRAEWFEAGRNGLQPAFVFAMFGPDYEGEKIVEFNGRRYGVYRKDDGKNDTIRLYVEEKGGLDEESDG